jgi:hypothetical protein
MRTPAPTQSPAVDDREYDETPPADESRSQDSSYSSREELQESRRKGTGGLRVSQKQSSFQEDLSEHQRQMQIDSRSFPKRKKVCARYRYVIDAVPSQIEVWLLMIYPTYSGLFDVANKPPAGQSILTA